MTTGQGPAPARRRRLAAPRRHPGAAPRPPVSYAVVVAQRSTRTRRPPAGTPRKDRVVQTRVPRALEDTLKAEARRRRLSVSQLIRNVLEDTFELVDGLVADVDRLVGDSVDLARHARRNARRIGRPREEPAPRRRTPRATAEPAPDEDAAPRDALAHVIAWNEVVLHRGVRCSACGDAIPRGASGWMALSDAPGAARAWLCPRCIESL